MARSDISRKTAWAIRSKTASQSPGVACRNSRMVGYQGLSLRSSIQRQSPTVDNGTRPDNPDRQPGVQRLTQGPPRGRAG